MYVKVKQHANGLVQVDRGNYDLNHTGCKGYASESMPDIFGFQSVDSVNDLPDECFDWWGSADPKKKKGVRGHASNPEESLRVSMSRTKNKLLDHANNICAEWFGTFTLNSVYMAERGWSRYSIDDLKKAFRAWYNEVKIENPDMRYLAVPELHKDGAYHLHIILSNVPNLTFVDSGRRDKSKKKRKIYNLREWKWGFTNFTVVDDAVKCANYMAKYITKELCVQFNKKRYWHSENIPEPICNCIEGSIVTDYTDKDLFDMLGIDCEATGYVQEIDLTALFCDEAMYNKDYKGKRLIMTRTFYKTRNV